MSGSTGLRVALLGAGSIAQAAHLPAWQEESRAQVTWAADTREDALQATCDRWSIPNWTTDWRNLLDRDDIDAVDVCLPGLLHAEVTTAFLERGTPVLVEKPVALTLADVARMREAQEGSGTALMVAENWPYSSAFRAVRDVLQADGAPWRVIQLQARHQSALRLTPSEGDGRVLGDRNRVGYLFSAGIHTLNLARWLAGEFDHLAGFATTDNRGEYGLLDTDSVLAARFVGGAVGSFAFTGRSRHVGERRLEFRVVAEEGVVTFDVLSGVVCVEEGGVRTTRTPQNPSMGFVEEIAHFVDCVEGAQQPRTSINDQERTMRALVAAYHAMGTRSVVVADEFGNRDG